jgi:outer membrane protein assembly factor BamA
MNPKFLGSSQNSTELFFEFRTYVGLSKKIPRHLIAFWLWGNFKTSGNIPYYSLKSLGDDQKGTSGRGYIAGRWRGENILYGEVEYRFPILKCAQTLGGVVFVNATTTTNDIRNVKLFDYVKPAAGIGLRILVNKNIRLNLTIDYAIGYNSQGVYFGSPDVF